VHDILCPECRARRDKLRVCPVCATYIAETETEDYRCRSCRGKERAFIRARSAMPYEGNVRDLLVSFKFHQQTGHRRTLAALLIDVVKRNYGGMPFDAVIPIPLHPTRLEERGYNQVELLTEILCFELDLPHHPEYLRRVKTTRPLSSLDRKERLKEIKGSFQALPAVKGKLILLVDDIFTTGATSETAAAALMKAGAAAVFVASVASGWEEKKQEEE